jgi:thymidylate synthase
MCTSSMENKLDSDYQTLLRHILSNGVVKKDRTGTGTLSTFGCQIRHEMSDGFPLLTTKKMAIKTMITELKWFLKGDTNIKYLVDNGCNIWNGDAFKNYISKTNEYKGNWPDTMDEFIEQIKTDDEFAKKWGDLGRIYGAQWREWIGFEQFDNHAETIYVDQIANLIRNIKENPDSRRLMVTAWNPSELHQVVLPPCHYGFQVYTRELTFAERYKYYSGSDKTWEEGGGNAYGKITGMDMMDDDEVPTRAISLMWNQRSVDTFLGLPFNIASYGLLLELLAVEVNMIPDELIGNLGDTHLYSNHKVQAATQLGREGFDLPKIKLSNVNLLEGQFDYKLINYNYHPSIKAELSN